MDKLPKDRHARVAKPGAVRRYLGIAIAALVMAVIPNTIWLVTSTVRIENESNQSIAAVGYRACETDHSIGTLGPGQSAFRFLEACGDDTLEVLIGDSRSCQTYVEGELYHVDAKIRAAYAVDCRYDDLFSSLFIFKVLR